MKLSETIDQIRYSLPSKRMLEVVNVGAVEVGDKLLILKSRHSPKEIEELRHGNQFIHYNENHGWQHNYEEIEKKNVIFDISVFNERGKQLIKELDVFE